MRATNIQIMYQSHQIENEVTGEIPLCITSINRCRKHVFKHARIFFFRRVQNRPVLRDHMNLAS